MIPFGQLLISLKQQAIFKSIELKGSNAMGVNRVPGGNVPRYDQKHQKSDKGQNSAQDNHHKVGSVSCDSQVRKTNTEHYQVDHAAIKPKQVDALDHPSDTFMKRNGEKSHQSDRDKPPKFLSKVANKGIKAKSAEEARGAIQKYFQLLRRSYSREAPPSPEIREQLYNDVVKLSARVMSFEFTAGRDKDKEKTLGLTAELLQQMLSGLKTSSAEFVNSQVTAVLSLGMMTPEDKAFLFGSCLNTQIISVDKYTADIRNLDNKISSLKTKLAGSKQGEAESLQRRIKSAGTERADLERKQQLLVSKEVGGMHGQKEFFQSCYEIMMKQVRSEIRVGLKKQLKQKNKANFAEGEKLVNQIMGKMDSTLRSKAESIAKNAANQKKGIQAEDVYQKKRTDLFLLLNEEVSGLLGGIKESSDVKPLPVHKNDAVPAHKVDDKTSFDRNSGSRKPVHRKKSPEANQLSTSVTEVLKEAVDKEDHNPEAPAAIQHKPSDVKNQAAVKDLIKFFEDVAEKHRIEDK
ncbi:hypothetical protein [Endozoicomonas sp. GU-1]|uniref:hypothetical protein n=1 Tax=Endozoicomonas sp. GU-1 TaxID=3009078 RepID=UPI0022B5E041|nr:hypothetical protein [Endozoicomonas sp. GU-1]WBA81640.1 hypothetical protein O2T12_00185 [Endozoicomonas sp. GU-1]WBA84593.1 hypothetical protein O3276_14995 [Endozoicomonas sp. GU-1]